MGLAFTRWGCPPCHAADLTLQFYAAPGCRGPALPPAALGSAYADWKYARPPAGARPSPRLRSLFLLLALPVRVPGLLLAPHLAINIGVPHPCAVMRGIRRCRQRVWGAPMWSGPSRRLCPG